MCTAITLCDINKNNYFGRTMDFSYILDPSIYICPRNYLLNNSLSNIEIRNKYSFIGIGQNIPKTIFADGVNEKGLAAAVLYFPGYAKYDLKFTGYKKYHIESLEMINFILGNCKDLEDAYSLMQNVNIRGVKDIVTNTVAPLHWIVTDRTGKCMVVENREDGMHLLANHIGVLSNSPNFEWHMTNLRNYINISQTQYEELEWSSVELKPFGQGGGGFGMPGDYTPPSRFIRAAYQKSHVNIPKSQRDSVVSFFHIMETVSIPKGIVITKRNTEDYTQYTSFMDLQKCEYFFKTYDNSQILKVKLNDIENQNEIVEIGKLSDSSKFSNIN